MSKSELHLLHDMHSREQEKAIEEICEWMVHGHWYYTKSKKVLSAKLIEKGFDGGDENVKMLCRWFDNEAVIPAEMHPPVSAKAILEIPDNWVNGPYSGSADFLANQWLTGLTDKKILDIFWDDSDNFNSIWLSVYESAEHYPEVKTLTEIDEDGWAMQQWINLDELRAWVLENRPHLIGRIDLGSVSPKQTAF